MVDYIQWLFGVLVFVFNIMAIIQILNSVRSPGTKLVWVLVILFLPVLGLLAYILFGRSHFASV